MIRKKSDAAEAAGYSRDQILISGRYAEKRDLLRVLLTDSREYTLEEVDDLIDNYMKGRVK